MLDLRPDVRGTTSLADAAVEAFVAGGARQIFGLPGESVNALLEAARTDERLQVVRVRHERWAPVAALADAACHRRPSGTFASAGPGVVNMLGGLSAWAGEDLPLVAVTGQVATEALGTGAFQELDVPSLCGWAVPTRELTAAAELPWFLDSLAHCALRRQPLLVSVPTDLWGTDVGPGPSRGAPAALAGLLSRARAVEIDPGAGTLLRWGAGGPGRAPTGPPAGQGGAVPVELRDCSEPRGVAGAVAVVTSERALRVLGLRREELSGLIILGARRTGMGRAGEVTIAWSNPDQVTRLITALDRADDGGDGTAAPGAARRAEGLAGPAWTLGRTGEPTFVLVDDDTATRAQRTEVGATTVVRSAVPGFSLAATLAVKGPAIAVSTLGSAAAFVQEFPGWLDGARQWPLLVHLVDDAGHEARRRRAGVTAGLAAVGLALHEVHHPDELASMAETALPGVHVSVLSRAIAERVGLAVADPPAVANPRRAVDVPLPAGRALFASEGASRCLPSHLRLTVAPAEHLTLMASGQAKATRSTPVAAITDTEIVAALPGILDARCDGRGFVLFVLLPSPEALHPSFAALQAVADQVIAGPPADQAWDPAVVHDLRHGAGGAVTVVLCSPGSPGSPAPAVVGPAPMAAPSSPCAPPSPATLDQLARLLSAHPRVTILLGGGSTDAVSEAVAVARLLPAALVTTMLGPSGHDLDADLYCGRAGESGHLSAYLALRTASLVVRVGVSNRGRGFIPPHGQPVVDITTDGPGAGASSGHLVRGRAAEVLGLLHSRLAQDASAADHIRSSRERHVTRSRSRVAWRMDERLRRPARDQLRSSDLVLALARRLRTIELPVTVAVDTGTVTLWAYRFLDVPGRILWGGSYATMGFAIPAAFGACVAGGTPAVALVGDGGALTSLGMFQELAERQVPVTVVVLNNGGMAAIRFEQMARSWPEFALEVGPFDFGSYCRSLGLPFCRATAPDDLEQALDLVAGTDGPLVVEALVDGTEVPHPWVPTASQMRGRLAALVRSVSPSPDAQHVLPAGARPLSRRS